MILGAIFFGIAIAYCSWSFTPEMVACSSLIFLAYFFIDRRILLFFIIFSYHLFASYGLLTGLINFYEYNYKISFLFWIGASFFSTLPWIIIWSKDKKKKLYLFPLALLLIILPPFGFITWVNPLLSSAVIFPFMGFLGICLYFILIYGIAILNIKYFKSQKRWLLSVIFLPFIVFMHQEKSINHKKDLYEINTNYIFKNNTIMDEYMRQKDILSRIKKIPKSSILLPEHILGTFTDSSMMLWERLPENKKLYAGADMYVPHSEQYDNVLLEITKNNYKVIYRQRVPVPFEMWQPYNNKGARASIISSGTVVIKEKKVGVFICYEQYLTYTYLDTMLQRPDYIIGISNLWWIKDIRLQNIQKNTLLLWARLFGIPYYYSANLAVK